jgi:glycosyltransferase involved in cell wall biosynthesis
LLLPAGAGRVYQGGLRTQNYYKRSIDSKPLVSVITVVFNGIKHLAGAINSVLGQSYDNIEYIVIDGGSTDGSLAIIKTYEDRIDYAVSEPDAGISDAFNKGLQLVAGDYCMFVNADDFLISQNSISEALSTIDPEGSIHWFRTGFLAANEQSIHSFNYPYRKRLLYYFRTYPQPSTLYQRAVFGQVGCFDTNLKNTMDTEFLIRAASRGVSIKSYPRVISMMRLGGVSSTAITTTIREGFFIRKKHLGIGPALIFTTIRWLKYWTKNLVHYAKAKLRSALL